MAHNNALSLILEQYLEKDPNGKNLSMIYRLLKNGAKFYVISNKLFGKLVNRHLYKSRQTSANLYQQRRLLYRILPLCGDLLQFTMRFVGFGIIEKKFIK